MSKYQITNQRDLRKAFWEAHPELLQYPGYHQNDYETDTRIQWVDYVDLICSAGIISEALANRATL